MAFIKIQNAEDGSDARYDVNAATPEERAQLDSEGRPLGADLPGQWEWTPGIIGARGGGDPNAGGGGGAGGFAGGAINSPFYQQALAATQAAAAADAASRKAAIQQMLIQFGEVPTGFTDPYGDVDQTTRDLATKNTSSGISVAARLKQALADAQTQSSRRLAAKGLRRSGARGFNMRKNQLGFDQNYSDAVSKLLSGSQDVYKGFGQGEYNRSMGLASALQSAINSMSSFYRPSSAPSYSAPSGGGGGGSYEAPSAPAYTPTSPYSQPQFTLDRASDISLGMF
jgi:hypothetical protein